MPSFSGFAPFGMLTFDDAPSPAQTAYVALQNALGPVVFSKDLTTYEGSRLFAFAILIGCVRQTIKRAYLQQVPLAVKDKIDSLASDWGVTFGATDDLNAKQLAIAAQFLLNYGARQEAIETALTAILGADFYTLRVTKPSERFDVPTVATDQGTFDPIGASPIYLKMNASIIVGTNTSINASLLGDSPLPLIGQKLTIDPSDANRTEVITITDVRAGISNDCAVTFVATKPHNTGTIAASCMPMWRSNQRHVAAVVAPSAAANSEKRRRIHETLAKHEKTVTDWSIVASTTHGASTGPWIVAVAIVGSTALGDTAIPT